MKAKLRFLTWNVSKNKNEGFFDYLNQRFSSGDEEIDIMVLQECLTGPISRLTNFIELTYPKNGESQWVRIFFNRNSNLDYFNLTPLINNKLLAVEIYYNESIVFTLIGVHYFSKLGRSDVAYDERNKDVSIMVNEIQEKHGHNRTIITGDFNCNPYDYHLSSPYRLNAINSKEVIRLIKKRRYGRMEFDFFYNPMWNLLGDYDYLAARDKPSGTYFWDADDPIKHYWNLIDGVLVNQEIMDSLVIQDLKILDDLVSYNYMSPLKQPVIEHSDHLPIIFSLNLAQLNF